MDTNNTIFENSKKVWEDNLGLFPQTVLKYPDENLVRLLSGRYVPIPLPPAKVLDHGFGTANTLEYLVNKGFECSGCEISQRFIDEAEIRLKHQADLRLVKGLEIPFEDNQFDLIISWNVIHYNGTPENVQRVVNELRRVLKTGGVLLLSTIHPDSSLFKRTEYIAKGSYKVIKGSIYDNRDGLALYCARASWELRGLFKDFSEYRQGYAEANLFNPERIGAWYLVYAVK